MPPCTLLAGFPQETSLIVLLILRGRRKGYDWTHWTMFIWLSEKECEVRDFRGTHRLLASWLSESFHVLIISHSLYSGLAFRVKLADVPGSVHFSEVNPLLPFKDTLPHDLFRLLQVDGEEVSGLVHTPEGVLHFDLVEKRLVYKSLERRC